MRVAIYARKSTEDKKNEELKSVSRQIANARKFAKGKGWTLDEKHIFDDQNKSGREFDNREGLKELLQVVKEGGVDVLVCMERSRLGRDQRNTGALIGEILDSNVRIFYYATNQEEKADDSEATLMGNVKGYADEVARKVDRTRARESHLHRAEKGYAVQNAPYGYTTVPMGSDHQPWQPGKEAKPSYSFYKVISEEAKVVNLIYDLYLEGYGLPRLAKRLGEMGIKSPRPLSRQGWWPATIRDILRREIYVGRLVWGRTYKQDKKGRAGLLVKQQPTVDRELPAELRIVPLHKWEAVQRRIQAEQALYLRNKKGQLQGKPEAKESLGRGSKHLFTGFGQCGVCGGGMIAKGGGKTQRRYYGCVNHHVKGDAGCPNSQTIRVEKLDDAVRDHLTEEIFQPNIIKQAIEKLQREMVRELAASPTTIQEKQKEKKKLEQEITRLVNLVASGNPPQSVLENIRDREKQVARLKQEIERFETLPQNGEKQVSQAVKYLESCVKEGTKLLNDSIPQARQLLKKFFPNKLIFTPTNGWYRIQGRCELAGLVVVEPDHKKAGIPGHSIIPGMP